MSIRRGARRVTIAMLLLLAIGLGAYASLFIPFVYFRVAFFTIQHSSLRRENVDWSAVWAEARELARGARTTADTYPAIRLVLTRLGDRHSHLLSPEAARAMRAGSALSDRGLTRNRPAVVRSLGGGLAYIEIPALVGPGGTFDTDAVAAIGREDRHARCAWVVDLRRNVGGNMWPMLRAVRPVLGEATPGYFVSGERRDAWSYKSGPVFSLKRPDPPVAVLTSRLTASSGEAVTIAFRGRPLTRSFGEATGGVPTANQTMALVDGALLVLTVANEADRTGLSYDGPIEPDERVAIDWARIGTDDDPVLRVAASWLRQQGQCAKEQ